MYLFEINLENHRKSFLILRQWAKQLSNYILGYFALGFVLISIIDKSEKKTENVQVKNKIIPD